MKKMLLILFLFFLNINYVSAESIKVKFSKCVDGDTARFIYNNEEITARFLAIDTPESVHPTIKEEEYGKEASDFTCNKLKQAKEIILEFDDNSDKTDKYGRYLVWIFTDGKLLQEELIEVGYAEVAYLYNDYKYTSQLEKIQDKVKKKKIGIWSLNSTSVEDNQIKTPNNEVHNKEYNQYLVIIFIIILLIIFIYSKKGRKIIIKRLKKKLKKLKKNSN